MSGISLETSMRLSQTLSPQMIQSLKLLQYSNLQLEQVIRKEIQENPILEEPPEEPADADASDTPQAGEGPADSTDEDAAAGAGESPDAPMTVSAPAAVDDDAPAPAADATPIDEVNWSDYEYEPAIPALRHGSDEDESGELYEKINVGSVSLEEHLLRQLHEKNLSDKRMEVGEFLIGNVDDKGYLAIPLQEVVEKFGMTLSEINEIRNVIQHLDPLGAASLDMRENLLVQVRARDWSDTLVSRILEHHFDLLKKYQIQEIAKRLSVSDAEVQLAIREIGKLEPNPGTLISSGRPPIITPELIVTKQENGDFLVSLNDGNVPSIRVSRSTIDLLRREKKRTPEIKKYISEKLNSANWLIRAIEQRKVTMLKVMNAIVERQREWFDKGPPHLRPLRLQEVADQIGMHISTVCRVTNDKYAQTPFGIFELKHFFGSGVEQEDGSEVSTSRAKDILKELVDGETKKKPLSDQRLVELLKDKGVEVARRTISKYREQLGILPARLRKEF